MTILLYIVSALLIIAGLSVFTKARNPTTAKMSGMAHVLLCLCFLAGGVLAIGTGRWLPILIAVGFAWIIHGVGERKRRQVRPSLLPVEYPDAEAVGRFMEWWLSNDAQVSEVRRPSTQAIWSEGCRPDEADSQAFTSAEEYFRAAFQDRLVRLQRASEQEWVDELEKTGRQAITFVQTTAEIGEKYGIDFDKFSYQDLDYRIDDSAALRDFKQAFLTETLLSNQRRLLMWLFHDRFGRYYTPQD